MTDSTHRRTAIASLTSGLPNVLDTETRATPPAGTMRRRLLLMLALLPGAVHAADARHPTVIELFTSQGCSSCPPAQANINALADRPDLLPLSFAVTYWDDLGWKDRFAQPGFTRRQRDYAVAGHRQAATPQVLLNGRIAVVGCDRAALDQAIRSADRETGGPTIAASAGHVAIGAAPATGAPATVWLVRYDPRTILVAVGAGENAGRTLPHRNVVRSLTALGRWDGHARSYAVPAMAEGGLRSAVLVQAGPGGTILAAAPI